MSSGSAFKLDFSPKQQNIGERALTGLVGDSTATGVTQLPISELVPYPNQPFKPYPADKLQELSQDIRQHGVLVPLIVRPAGDCYEILAGHNRCQASREAGLTTVPALVRNVDDDTAAMIMTTTNLNQREKLLPSEKAWAYKIQLDAIKKKMGRPSLEKLAQVGPVFQGKESTEIVAEQVGESRNQIKRFIRLTQLLPEWLQMVDEGQLAFIPGVELSFLTADEQTRLLDIAGECNRKISNLQAQQLKKASQSGGLTSARMHEILLPAKPWNPRGEFTSATKDYIPSTATKADIAAVARLVEDYFKAKR